MQCENRISYINIFSYLQITLLQISNIFKIDLQCFISENFTLAKVPDANFNTYVNKFRNKYSNVA